MSTHVPATPVPALLAAGLRKRFSRWLHRLREAHRRRREAKTLAGLPDGILRDIGLAGRDWTPPSRPGLTLGRR